MANFCLNRCSAAALIAAASFTASPARADAPHDIATSQRLWLDGLDIAGSDSGNGGGNRPASGATISNWQDKSANAFVAGDATSFSPGLRSFPTYDAAGQGVSFDGVFNILEISAGIYGLGATVSASDIYLVANTRSIKNSFVLLSGPVYNTGNRISAHIPWSNGTIYWDHVCCGAGRLTTGWGGAVLGQAYLWNFGASAPSSQNLWRDGATLASIASSASYTQNADNHFYIGGGENGSGHNHNGTISEMIVYARQLLLAERRILLSYLSAKYANPGGIGGDQRYANGAGYRYHVGGIGRESDGSLTLGTSAGLTITAGSFLAANGSYLIAGLPSLDPASGSSTADLNAATAAVWRASRIWHFDVTGATGGSVNLSFDLGKLGLLATNGQNWRLLYRSGTSGAFSVIETVSYTGGTLDFSIPAAQLADGYYTVARASNVNIGLVKSSQLVRDPVNGTSDAKLIPGAEIRYLIGLSNQQDSPDSNSITVDDPLPAELELFVGNLAAGAPYALIDGSPASGLSAPFISLSASGDAIEFYNAADQLITPVPDADGYDPLVRRIRLMLSGQFAAKAPASAAPNCTIEFQVRVR